MIKMKKIYSKRSINNKRSDDMLDSMAHYESLSIDLTPLPWNCDKIEYCVTQINFTADYYLTTSDDYIEIEFEDTHQIRKCTFQNITKYDADSWANLATYLELNVFIGVLRLSGEANGTLRLFHDTRRFRINYIDNRARWLLGTRQVTPTTYGRSFYCDELPSFTYGNLMYLTSLQGESVSTTTETNTPIAPSVIYRINQFMRPGLPVILNKKQSKIITNPISKIDITLTDIYFNPIPLLSRLYVAIEVKPIFSQDK
jgi:hypothetical protein